MKKQKRRLLTLALIFTLSATCFAACAEEPSNDSSMDSSSPVEDIKKPEDLEQVESTLGNPRLENISVRAMDVPETFYVGNATLAGLSINGEPYGEENYTIKNGCLVLNAESWREIGLGEIEFAFDFATYEDVTITVTVSEIDYTSLDLFSEENLSLWTTNGNGLSLQWVEETTSVEVQAMNENVGSNLARNFFGVNVEFLRQAKKGGAACILFDYQLSENVENVQLFATTRKDFLVGNFAGFTAQAGEWNTATIDLEELFAENENAEFFGIVLNGEKNGTVALKNWRVGTLQEKIEYRISQFENDYGFSDLNVTNWQIASPYGMSLSWSIYEQALQAKQITAEDAHFDSRYCAFYTSKYFLQFALEAGYEGITFKVHGDENFLNGEQRGIRVFSKKYEGLDSASIYKGTKGVTIYKDFKLKDGEEEILVKINAKDFLALDEEAPYFAIVPACKRGGNVYFSNMKLEKTLPVDPDEIVSEETKKWGFTESNTEGWAATNPQAMFIAWDDDQKAMRVTTANGAVGAIDGRQVAIYKDIAFLKEMQAAGYASFSFKVTCNEIFRDYAQRGVRVFSKKNAGLDNSGIVDNPAHGLYVYETFGTETGVEEFIVSVDIARFLALNPQANYFGLVISSAGNGMVWLSDMQFDTNPLAPPPGEVISEETKKWGFTESNTEGWAATNPQAMFIAWDEAQKAMRVTTANGAVGTIDGRQVAIYKDIAFLKEMLAAGYSSFSFKVKGNAIFRDYVQHGVRVFSKQNAGLDNSGIIDNPAHGLYVYETFGTETGVEEFTVRVDIAEFLALNTEAKYFGLVISSAGNGVVWLSDMQFEK